MPFDSTEFDVTQQNLDQLCRAPFPGCTTIKSWLIRSEWIVRHCIGSLEAS